ncbi:hypothetical protein B9Q06_03225 [Candidatus Marsarchaeota G2 archaeon ECH_B_2]|uniref:Uncharacterized protein n=4 Tax=Candidatus Marsarchaeota group 2 TaxID=2203771 RepID=A0A2R6BBT8_9ARCH|nr:MAG: hypothetical protein B9Q08_05030 [Candidatus Marsarchaeota G2 archaeon ECH_B_SAG-M15]PSN96101.1 MAG: hypothetical protein B9Q06_03225 [Candidatus Marsarchaeota G2 archaeon ECH_B_2]PSO00204.1 MAG: hypothetical protein B9Q07_04585 [Candidatus Marsarchaeota G2 archaeon ECH_B_3]PSO02699.1 MAG: hypothetical protein B9Q05_04115 [Candidatus Marsarchaeota G2 archaeon ECH_B_1]
MLGKNRRLEGDIGGINLCVCSTGLTSTRKRCWRGKYDIPLLILTELQGQISQLFELPYLAQRGAFPNPTLMACNPQTYNVAHLLSIKHMIRTLHQRLGFAILRSFIEWCVWG